ncbi:hypothetical protein KPH14_012630 [Odynerus spinipes]|uniref:Integrase zinc-binding domain-containing protein n=1 Tax=Odynerus spinipes TaxID=1348599 RepID=A0AAD9VKZ6_9HYME|nr:hypothetical protein KPH14_012630 [Odynerus spinipes]
MQIGKRTKTHRKKELVRRLKLKCNKQDELIGGVNSSKITSAKTAQIKIRSRHADYEAIIECLVLPTVTEKLPQVKINTKLICVPDGLELADPNFHEPGPVDVLLGAGLFWQLMCADSIIQQKGLPTLKNTLLGWIVGGELIDAKPKSPKLCGLITNSALQKQLERFWNQEETNETRLLTEDEADCERQFEESLKRDETGRFIVTLPKKENVVLGESENQAIRRLYAIERRFKANPAIKSDYIKFMKDYEDQGHMSTIVDESARSKDIYILPHQPVIRPDSMTTKLRVVFDASAKTSNGMALNDKLMVGPNLQRDLFDIILRFRAHEFVITADITAMFRQIMIREEDRDLQRILWRSDQTKPIKSYRLNTVTYGTAPAPYLAIRCLRQLAKENMDFPEASRVLREDFYMDDVLTGAKTVEAAMALQQQLSELLQRGQFQLRKWRSNEPRVLENLSNETEVDSLMKIDKDGALKTLGLLWNAKSDTMQYRVEIEEKEAKITKRLVLSKISQVFDPLGLLGPVIINGKWIMQQMWQLNTGWDEPLSQGLRETWNQYYSDLPRINQVQISRNINGENVEETFDLVGFGDASEKAYGACLYASSRNKEGQLQSHLICSKSRVAPLKTISLPRLELNAALLLSKLSDAARKAYGDKIKGLYLWSDSTIVLSWIATAPNILKTYVANRVSKIQDLTKNVNWMHVPSKENPADLISRGMTVDNWKNNELWWHGPSWLVKGEWPQRKEIEIDTSEMKSAVILLITTTYDVLRRFSSFEKLQRIIAYWLRFKTNALGGKKNGTLSVEELAVAERSIIKMTQRESFSMELQALEHDESVPKNSKLAAFCPFLDENGLIRVGGRLMRADIPEEAKHPVIIPSKHHITKIIMKKEHLRLHHCGPEQLLYSLRQKYWPLSGRREAQKVTRSCLECFRRKPKFPEIIMGDLPSGRISGSLRPFTNAGVDYAGPLQVRESRRRGRIHVSKAWMAVFVCFATKAVHLELVTELTTESFLAALRRFVGRRGVCSQISSDNGTNFVGAAKDLKEVYEFLKTEHDAIADNFIRLYRTSVN